MSVDDLAIDVGLAKDSDEYDVFVSCVQNILELGNRYSKEATEEIIQKCQQSQLDIAHDVIEACTTKKNSQFRRSKLKWWETYVPRRERISRDIVVDRRPDRRNRTGASQRRRHKRERSPVFHGRDRRQSQPRRHRNDRRQNHEIQRPERRHKRPMSPMFQRPERRRKRPMSPMFQRPERRRKRPMSPMFQRPDRSISPVYQRSNGDSSAVPSWKRRKVN